MVLCTLLSLGFRGNVMVRLSPFLSARLSLFLSTYPYCDINLTTLHATIYHVPDSRLLLSTHCLFSMGFSNFVSLSGVPDYFYRNKISSGGDHPLFQCLTVLEFSFILFDLCLLITFFNFIMNYVPIVIFWIFTYHKI